MKAYIIDDFQNTADTALTASKNAKGADLIREKQQRIDHTQTNNQIIYLVGKPPPPKPTKTTKKK